MGLRRHWRDSVLDALRRRSAGRTDGVVHRDELLHELDRIVAETHSDGGTPGQTLSFILQGLRDEGLVEFLEPGRYRLKNPSA